MLKSDCSDIMRIVGLEGHCPSPPTVLQRCMSYKPEVSGNLAALLGDVRLGMLFDALKRRSCLTIA